MGFKSIILLAASAVSQDDSVVDANRPLPPYSDPTIISTHCNGKDNMTIQFKYEGLVGNVDAGPTNTDTATGGPGETQGCSSDVSSSRLDYLSSSYVDENGERTHTFSWNPYVCLDSTYQWHNQPSKVEELSIEGVTVAFDRTEPFPNILGTGGTINVFLGRFYFQPSCVFQNTYTTTYSSDMQIDKKQTGIQDPSAFTLSFGVDLTDSTFAATETDVTFRANERINFNFFTGPTFPYETLLWAPVKCRVCQNDCPDDTSGEFADAEDTANSINTQTVFYLYDKSIYGAGQTQCGYQDSLGFSLRYNAGTDAPGTWNMKYHVFIIEQLDDVTYELECTIEVCQLESRTTGLRDNNCQSIIDHCNPKWTES